MPVDDDAITLEVVSQDDGVPLKAFITKLRDFLRALISLDIEMSADRKKTTKWVIVEASYNSPLRIRVAPRPIRAQRPKNQVSRAYLRGLKILETGAGEPPYFTPYIMGMTKKVLGTTGGHTPLVLFSGPESETVTSTENIVRNIDQIVRGKYYKEYTTIEGMLEALNVHDKYACTVYDLLADQATICYFDPDDFKKAHLALGKRVAVTGLATLNRMDHPVSLKVDELVELRESRDLPQFLTGEELDITGGLDSAEYIRRMRDAE